MEKEVLRMLQLYLTLEILPGILNHKHVAMNSSK